MHRVEKLLQCGLELHPACSVRAGCLLGGKTCPLLEQYCACLCCSTAHCMPCWLCNNPAPPTCLPFVSRMTFSTNTGDTSAPAPPAPPPPPPRCSPPCSARATSSRLRLTQAVSASSSAASARLTNASHSCCTSSLSAAKRRYSETRAERSTSYASAMLARVVAWRQRQEQIERDDERQRMAARRAAAVSWHAACVPQPHVPPPHQVCRLACVPVWQVVQPLPLHPHQQRLAEQRSSGSHCRSACLKLCHGAGHVAARPECVSVVVVGGVAGRPPGQLVHARQHAAVQVPGEGQTEVKAACANARHTTVAPACLTASVPNHWHPHPPASLAHPPHLMRSRQSRRSSELRLPSTAL